MKITPVFSDDRLEVLVEELRVKHDRKISVAALRDAVSVIERELFYCLANPDG